MPHLTAASIRTVACCLVLILGVATHGADRIVNGTIERGKIKDPEGWRKACVPNSGLIMRRTRVHPFEGEWSLSIRSVAKYERPVSNNWCQELKGFEPGRAFRLAAAVRAKEATVGNVCIQCWSKDNSLVAYASTPPVRGTFEWTQFETKVFTIPKSAKRVIVRAALTGTGQIWFDNIRLVPVEHPNVAATSPRKLEETLAGLLPGRLVKSLPVTKDCMILAYLPEWNHGLVDNLGVANNAGGVRALVKWSSVAPEIATNTKNRFLLALYSRKTTSKGPASEVVVSRVEQDWPEKCPWNSQPKSRDGNGHPLVRRKFTAADGWQLFDVTPIVREEAQEKSDHHGVVIRFEKVQPVPEARSGVSYLEQSQSWSGYSFVSREGAGKWSSFRPVLLVVETEGTDDP